MHAERFTLKQTEITKNSEHSSAKILRKVSTASTNWLMMKVSSENEGLMCSDEIWFVFVICTQTLSSLNKTRDDSKVLLSLSFSVKEVRDRRKYIKKLIHVQLKRE